jgi:hypothetical protein
LPLSWPTGAEADRVGETAGWVENFSSVNGSYTSVAAGDFRRFTEIGWHFTC